MLIQNVVQVSNHALAKKKHEKGFGLAVILLLIWCMIIIIIVTTAILSIIIANNVIR